MKLRAYELKDIETNLEIRFVEHILDAMMKCGPAGFLCNLEIRYTIISVIPFSMILKPKRLVYSVFSSTISLELLLTLQ